MWAARFDAKSNEIPAFKPLLDAVEQVLGCLTGVLLVADALHAQTRHACEIAARGAQPDELRRALEETPP